LYRGMPANALEYVGADHVAAARDIGPLIGRLVKDGAGTRPGPPGDQMRREVALMDSDDGALTDHHPGIPSAWPCPDCHGVLWEISDGPVLRFRCRVGHAWSAESLLHEQGAGVEAALWMALRALEDRAALSQTMAESAEQGGRPISANRFRQDLGDMSRSLDILRRLLTSDRAGPSAVPDDDISGAKHD
jgi:two-component system, chemotaxis family, protein-glutamate methylesterase/glutaminase